MNAILIIKTKNGYAIAPYSGGVPDNFVDNMSVADRLSGYSGSTVMEALQELFEKPEAEGQ